MSDQTFWQAKVAAYIHDPASKALILMRGVGHEKGSIKALRNEIFGDAEELNSLNAFDNIVKIADRWASAADRPSLPVNLRTTVNFVKEPELIHPLTGSSLKIASFHDEHDMAPHAIEALNFAHFKNFIVRDDDEIDWKKTFLAFWRFGNIPPASGLGLLWQELPADTRSPDHSIWEHLSLTSAFTGALYLGKIQGAALLIMSFGPVQGFISQARSTSDLWAGSHLLSTMVWQAMKVICDRYGPDAILFPNLHQVALVDVWLRKEVGLDKIWPKEANYPKGASEANPLFTAALPNRFLALIPADHGKILATEIEKSVREWVRKRLDEVLKEIGLDESNYAKKQVESQLAFFPEVNWSVVPWSLAIGDDNSLDDQKLKESLKILGHTGSYLDEIIYDLLKKKIEIDGTSFYVPNPGVAYPGLFELTERLHAAAKSARPFDGSVEHGFRCSICGEREWLTDNSETLKLPPGKRTNTNWARLKTKFGFIKEGEHLCSWCALKRFWPRLFVRWAERQTDVVDRINRYVISTHTMALATSLWNVSSPDGKLFGEESSRSSIEKLMEELEVNDTAALPHKLYKRIRTNKKELEFARKLPLLLDKASELENSEIPLKIEENLKSFFRQRPERYYGFILMDGDRMGKWLAAASDTVPKLGSRFHEKIRGVLQDKGLDNYLQSKRPASPGWHQTISSALNNFSVVLARCVVEEIFMGKLIYAGGDDLMAMVAVSDLPGLMLALRCVYSGIMPWESGSGASSQEAWEWLTNKTMPENLTLSLAKGFALIQRNRQKRLLRLMGDNATASIGAVIAHHKTPLARVLNELRAAEKRAKDKGKRDAFSLALMKRSGEQNNWTGKWHLDSGIKKGDMGLMIRLRNLLAMPDMSRRVAYILSEVVRDVPPYEDALFKVIRHHFFRQGVSSMAPLLKEEADELAYDLVKRSLKETEGEPIQDNIDKSYHLPGAWLKDIFVTAEFLARSGRMPEVVKAGGTS